MVIAFFLITLFVAEFRTQIASYDVQGILPYRFGMYVFCRITDAVFAFTAGLYLGIIVGIVYFALYYFAILHSTVAWIFKAPSLLFAKTPEAIQKIIQADSVTLVLSLLALTVFSVVSIFVVDFELAVLVVKKNWLVFLISAVVGFVLRLGYAALLTRK